MVETEWSDAATARDYQKLEEARKSSSLKAAEGGSMALLALILDF